VYACTHINVFLRRDLFSNLEIPGKPLLKLFKNLEKAGQDFAARKSALAQKYHFDANFGLFLPAMKKP
jgi:hypothetical protein